MNNKFRLRKLILFFLAFTMIWMQLAAQDNDESYQFSYALKLYNQKFYDLASQQFSQYINRFSGDKRVPDAHYYLAQCYEKMNKADLAIIEYKKLALDYSEHPKAIEAWKKTGKLYEESGKLKEAAKAYENIQILYSDKEAAAEGLWLAGKVYYAMHDPVNARRVLNDILSRYPESPYVYKAELLIATIFVDSGDYPEGIARLQKLVAAGDKEISVPAKIELTATYLNMNSIGKAEEVLKSLPENSFTPEAVSQQIRLFFKKKEYEKAIALLKLKIRNENVNKDLYLKMLIDGYFLNGNFRDALNVFSLFDKEIKEDILLMKKMLLMIKSGNFSGFNSLLQREFSDKLESDLVAKIIIEALNEMTLQKDYKSMQMVTEYLRENCSVQFFDANISPYFIVAAYEQGDYDKLTGYLSRNLDRLKGFPVVDDALYYSALMAEKRGDYSSAAEYLKKLTEVYTYSPFYASAGKEKEKINKYYVKNAKIGPEKIIDFLGTFIEVQDRAKLNLILGEMCSEQIKDFERALTYYKKALREGDETLKAEIYRKIYDAMWALGEMQDNSSAYMDSAKVYLKLYNETEKDALKKARVNLQFFKRDLPAILSSSSRAEQVLTLISAWQEGNIGLERKEINDVLLYLLPKDSLINLVKREKGKLPAEKPAVWFAEAADAALAQGADSAAAEFWLLTLQYYPDTHAAGESVLKLMDYYEKREDWDRFEQLYKFADKRFFYVEKLRLESLKEKMLVKSGNYKAAVRNFSRQYRNIPDDMVILRELFPQFVADSYYAGLAYYYLNKPDSSLFHLNNYLTLSEEDNVGRNRVYKIMGELALEQKNNSDAKWYLEKYGLQNNKEDFLKVKDKLIELYLIDKEYTKVKQTASELLKNFPNDDRAIEWEYFKIKANMFLDNGKKFGTELAAFKKKYKKGENYKKILTRLLLDYVYLEKNLKNFKIADETLKEAAKLKVKTEKPHILYLKGYLATIQNKDEEAMKLLSEFVGKYGESEYLSNVYLTLGQLYYRSDKKSDALEAYRRAVNSAKRNEDLRLALNNLIVLNKELGFWDGVMKSCRRYIETFPEDELNMEKKIWIGLSYSRLNRFDQAISYFKEIKPFAGSEREPEIQFYIGEAYFNSGRYSEAITEFLKIPLLSQKTELQWEASALYFAGQAYERMGKKGEAIHMYREIVNRPGILWELKKEAKKKIDALQN